MIYKTNYGHIDLSKIVSISNPYLIYEGVEGWGFMVCYDIHFQLMDNPITHKRKLTQVEQQLHSGSYTPVLAQYNKVYEGFFSELNHSETLAYVNMQNEIVALLEAWELFKNKNE